MEIAEESRPRTESAASAVGTLPATARLGRAERWRDNVKSIPVPERGIVCGLPAAPSLMTRAPVTRPGELGEKVTAIVQLCKDASEAPQVFDCENDPGARMLEIMNGAPPTFVRVMEDGPLVLPTILGVNVSPAGGKEAWLKMSCKSGAEVLAR